MCSLKKGEYLLDRYLFLVLSVFMSFSFLDGNDLADDILEQARKVACLMAPTVNPSGLTLTQVSQIIKNCYNSEKSFPESVLEAIDKEKGLKNIILEHGKVEKDLADSLADVFRVSATLMKTSFRSEKDYPLDLNTFKDEFYPLMKKDRVGNFEFIAYRRIFPNIKTDPIWKEKGFYASVTCVFFAILPDVPEDYSPLKLSPKLEQSRSKSPSPRDNSSDEGSVGGSRSRSPKTPPSESNFVWRLWGYFFGSTTT